jgi:hypothetical protein
MPLNWKVYRYLVNGNILRNYKNIIFYQKIKELEDLKNKNFSLKKLKNRMHSFFTIEPIHPNIFGSIINVGVYKKMHSNIYFSLKIKCTREINLLKC